MTASAIALDYFHKGYNCSQAVLVAFSERFGISEDDLLKTGAAFGGGMGRRQMTCGAVTGALMVLGLAFGRGTDDPPEKKTMTYDLAEEIMQRFEKVHGSVNCLTLLDNLDMKNPGDLEKINERNLFRLRCDRYVEDATELAGRMLDEYASAG